MFHQVRQLWIESPDKNKLSPGLVTVCAEEEAWIPAAQLGEHSPTWVSQTFFGTDCGPAQSVIYIFIQFLLQNVIPELGFRTYLLFTFDTGI